MIAIKKILNTKCSVHPSFSVVVPAYNREQLLEACLQSVAAQSIADWERQNNRGRLEAECSGQRKR